MRKGGGVFVCVLIESVGGRNWKWHSVFLARLRLIAFVSPSVWLKRMLGRLVQETEGRNLQKGQIMWTEWKHKGECHNRYPIKIAIMIYNSKNDVCICWLSFSLIRYSHFAWALSLLICSLLKRATAHMWLNLFWVLVSHPA